MKQLAAALDQTFRDEVVIDATDDGPPDVPMPWLAAHQRDGALRGWRVGGEEGVEVSHD